MLPKRYIGPIVVWGLALLPFFFWLVADAPSSPGAQRRFDPSMMRVGQVAGLLGMAMLSISFVLASRARFMEDYFGGLDKMYQVHHRMGLTAFVLLLIHPVSYGLGFIPLQIDRAILFLLPVHGRAAVNLGVFAFWGLVLLMILTLYTRVPYDKWKLSHKLLGLVLVVSAIHMLAVEQTRARPVAMLQNSALRTYMIGLAALGMAAFLYKLIALPLLSRRHLYTVEAARRISDDVLEVELRPRGRPVVFTPGQFVFVTFYGPGLSREAHPLTICNVPDDDVLVLTAKVLGDFTDTLYQELRAGAVAKIEGPYGRFDFRKGTRKQIWLAGGVGIVPFLSWARSMADSPSVETEAILYYCVHSRGDAVHFEEFRTLANQLDALEVVLVCSEEQGHIQAADLGDVRDRDIYMCGPRRFTEDLRRQLLDLDVPRDRIHFEDFEFRSPRPRPWTRHGHSR